MSKTILVIEDDEMNMRLFSDLLHSRGYQVLRAFSGLAGLQLARAHNPQLIVMDVQLPDISGLDVTREIRRDRSLNHIPVLAVTAFAMKGDGERILAAGCTAYVPKPIMVEEFLNVVARVLSDPERDGDGAQPKDDSDPREPSGSV